MQYPSLPAELEYPDPYLPAERLRSGWLNGIKHWQVDYTGKCPVSH